MTHQPDISVVIATYGRPVKLRRCLAGLARLRKPRDRFEVIVVDDGSDVDVVEALGCNVPDNIAIAFLRQQNMGPGIARNTGVQAAQGRWIAFIDDDCVPHPEWLTRMERALEAHPDCMVGGRILNGYSDSLFDTASWVLLDYLYDYMRRAPEAPHFFATMNVGVSREHFLELGGFDTSTSFLAEDRDFCERWIVAGRTLVEAPDAIIKHFHGLSLSGFVRQHAKYGRGAHRFHQARARRRAKPVRLEPSGFYTGLLLSPLQLRVSMPYKVALCACMLLSQMAMVVGYFADKYGGGRRGATTQAHDPHRKITGSP